MSPDLIDRQTRWLLGLVVATGILIFCAMACLILHLMYGA